EGVALSQLPRIYLASPADIARRMREAAERTGAALLYEQYDWTAPETGLTAIERLPSSWLFSEERIQELLYPVTTQEMPGARAAAVRPETSALGRAGLREAVLTA